MRKTCLCLLVLLLGMVALTGCKKDGTGSDSTPEEVTVQGDQPEAKKNSPETEHVTPPENSNNTLMPIPSPIPDISGRYQGVHAVLDIRQVSPELSRFSLQMNATEQCSGELNGVLSVINEVHGEYVEENCTLNFTFNNDGITITEKDARCYDHHAAGCSFSGDYRISIGAIAVEAKPVATMVAGHYMHKRISMDDAQCTGWEIWLTGVNSALDAMVSVYTGDCNIESIGTEDLQYDVSRSTLNFDVYLEGSRHHFSGVFDEDLDLHGQFTP